MLGGLGEGSDGESSNDGLHGFPWADSDIYANRLSHAFDDAIEAEGGNRNVRIWGNFIDRAYVAFGNARTSVGPLYVWRNISHQMALMRNPAGNSDTEIRGQFVKGGNKDNNNMSGRAYYFHNTMLQPPPAGVTYFLGAHAGLYNVDGNLFNFVSKNNIWHNYRTDRYSIRADCDTGFCEYDYDLYDGLIRIDESPATYVQENWGPPRTPKYASSNAAYPDLVAQPGNFSLAQGTPGRGQATLLPNFNDQYSSRDIGAHQSGTDPMKFGVAAATQGGGGTPAGLPVFDDFEDGNSAGWTFAGTHSWSVITDGPSKVFKQSDASAGARALLDASTGWTDQVIEADVKVESFNGTDRWAGLFVRYTDINNTYFVTLRSSNKLTLRKIVDGAIATLAEIDMIVSLGTPYRLRLEAVGSTLKVYVGAAPNPVVTITDTQFASGRAGVGTFAAVASFDNVLVTPTPLSTLTWLQDNFRDGNFDGWTLVGTTWSVTSSAGNNVLSQSDTTGGNRAILAASYWRDQSVEADVKITGTGVSSSVWAGLFVRYTNVSNTYYVTLRHGTNELSLRKIVNDVITDLDTAASFAVDMNRTYKVRLEAIGPNLKVYVDGALKLQATDTTFAAGRVGVGTNRASAHFDSIVMGAGAQMMPLNDNFEDANANGWTPGGTYNWSVVMDGTWVYKQSNATAGAHSIFAGNSPNQAIQARVKALTFSGADDWVGLAARYADFNNHYYITARTTPTNQLLLRKTVGGVFTTLASAPFTIATGVWYKFRLEALGPELRVYVDANDAAGWKLLIDHTDLEPLTAGNDFGIRMFGATAEYDDVVGTTTPP